ncbi:MAG TPA: hypothetical protein VFB37_06265 [Steroidobacteraceae bacterium]|nr:hypothetical protein [Steroidobacteraceae bacterium]
MSVASRPVTTGKTRTCPHCKATILESLSICPGCMHHLRFDSEAAKRQVAATPALRVEGIIRHPPLDQPLEYFVIIAIRNDRGEEVTRQVVNVGALQAAEKRTFTLSVEVLPPQVTGTSKAGTSAAPPKPSAPQPSATVRAPPAGAPSAAGTPGTSTTSTNPVLPAPASQGSAAPGATPGSPPAGSSTSSTTRSPQTGYPGGLKPPIPGGPKRH